MQFNQEDGRDDPAEDKEIYAQHLPTFNSFGTDYARVCAGQRAHFIAV